VFFCIFVLRKRGGEPERQTAKRKASGGRFSGDCGGAIATTDEDAKSLTKRTQIPLILLPSPILLLPSYLSLVLDCMPNSLVLFLLRLSLCCFNKKSMYFSLFSNTSIFPIPKIHIPRELWE